jgi:hypothetical protein
MIKRCTSLMIILTRGADRDDLMFVDELLLRSRAKRREMPYLLQYLQDSVRQFSVWARPSHRPRRVC